jgi:hypothetical protein
MIAELLVLALGPAPADPPKSEPDPADSVVPESSSDIVPVSSDAYGSPNDPDQPGAAQPSVPDAPTAPGEDRWTGRDAQPKEKAAPSEAAIARDSTVPPWDPQARRKSRWQRPGSPQRFAFEFKIGPYLPEVDKAYKGPGFGPYATIFGQTDSTGHTVKKPKVGVMPAFAFEWQFIYLAGPLALGTQIAFFVDKADAIIAEPKPTDKTIRSTADSTKFGMVPLSLLLIYRFELLADFYKVPLVPYAKVGLAYAFWWVKDGTGKVAVNEAGVKGRGGVIGWQLNPGLMIRLDAFEPSASKKLDQSTKINHAYLFGEFQLTRLRNFGVGHSIDLGDKTALAGIAIEF